MNHPVILSAVRLPIGKFQGSLKLFSAPELGALAVRAAIERTNIDLIQIDEVIMGNVLQAGLGQNPARQAALKAGCLPNVSAVTINQVCGSGLRAVMIGAHAIQTGDAEYVVAGGMESMTNAPYLLTKAREGYRLGNGELVDSMINDGLWCAFKNWHMGITGEIVAEKYNISRDEQDTFAANSHTKAIRAISNGTFKNEIQVVTINQKKGEQIIFDTDECPRNDTTVTTLSKLKPAFKNEGTVTAGNASSINDGAAALVITSEQQAYKLNQIPIARIAAQAISGIEPSLVMMAPVEAVKKVLKKANWTINDVNLIELNEAFASQAIAVTKELGANPDHVNINGGAIALGHPIGASGARILVTLLHSMRNHKAKKGIASLCLGGGNAVAIAVEQL